jgi:Holliday junction DNA helicase RuvA
MIGYLSGEVIFSDASELIIKTKDGIGYQVYFRKLLAEGSTAEVFISHIIREASQELFGFENLREKKLFELLNSVKGVGPKSAYSLLASLGEQSIIQAIQLENKKTLSKAPGVGPKAAAQICLDLSDKVQRVVMYSGGQQTQYLEGHAAELFDQNIGQVSFQDEKILEEALMACKELGFKEELISVTARKILKENEILRPEQLVHLVLKEV